MRHDETAPVSFITRPSDGLERRVITVGTVMPHVDAEIVDPFDGSTLPLCEPGEICTRRYFLMTGYWESPEATAAAIDDDGWIDTGELGVMDADVYVNIVGRMKDMVIRGGENVYPREVEEVLFEHTVVGSAQVIGVLAERMGEELTAWIVVHDGATFTDDDVRAFCRERLGTSRCRAMD